MTLCRALDSSYCGNTSKEVLKLTDKCKDKWNVESKIFKWQASKKLWRKLERRTNCEVVSESSQTVLAVRQIHGRHWRSLLPRLLVSLLLTSYCLHVLTFYTPFHDLNLGLLCDHYDGWQSQAVCLHQILHEAWEICYEDPFNVSSGFWWTF